MDYRSEIFTLLFVVELLNNKKYMRLGEGGAE